MVLILSDNVPKGWVEADGGYGDPKGRLRKVNQPRVVVWVVVPFDVGEDAHDGEKDRVCA